MEEKKSSPFDAFSDSKGHIDVEDDLKCDLAVTKSGIELTDIDELNKVSEFEPPLDSESKGDIRTASELQDIEEAERLRNEANDLFRVGMDISGAVNVYTKAITLNKNNYITFNNRAAAHLVNGDFEKAIKDCNSSLKIKNNVKAHCRKAKALGNMKRFPEAFDSIDEALKLNAQDKESASVKQSLLRDEVAFKELTRANAIKQEGNELLQTKDYSGAIQAYTRALSISGDNYVVYNNRAVAYLMTGDNKKAVEDCDRSLAIKKNAKAYCRKAEAMRKLSNLEDGMIAINKALKLNMDDVEVKRVHADLLRDQELYENDLMSFYEIQERSTRDIVDACMGTSCVSKTFT